VKEKMKLSCKPLKLLKINTQQRLTKIQKGSIFHMNKQLHLSRKGGQGMKFLIFSDESGRWNATEYYIRSWLKIAASQYNLVEKEVFYKKYKKNVKELKWDKFKTNYETFKSIFDLDFEVFVTISKLSHFQSRKYNIIEAIKTVEFPGIKKQRLVEKIRERVTYAVKQELFFNYFEKQHIENSVKALLPNEKPKDYDYFADNPQYRDWKDIAKECGINNVNIVEKSEECPGVELADVVCGCIYDITKGDKKAKTIYEECIKGKMVNMNSKDVPNPNLIFYNDFSDKEKMQLNIFR